VLALPVIGSERKPFGLLGCLGVAQRRKLRQRLPCVAYARLSSGSAPRTPALKPGPRSHRMLKTQKSTARPGINCTSIYLHSIGPAARHQARPYQMEAIEAVLNHVLAGERRGAKT
jgi:hypothetical protein